MCAKVISLIIVAVRVEAVLPEKNFIFNRLKIVKSVLVFCNFLQLVTSKKLATKSYFLFDIEHGSNVLKMKLKLKYVSLDNEVTPFDCTCLNI